MFLLQLQRWKAKMYGMIETVHLNIRQRRIKKEDTRSSNLPTNENTKWANLWIADICIC